jgi:hypothetical protein
MQLQLPIFSAESKMISNCVGYYTRDGIVQYIVNGLPVYAHAEEDLNSFRFITSNFIEQGLCKKVEIKRAFHVSEDTVYRYHKMYVEQGADAFFGKKAVSKKRSHKIVGKTKEKIQNYLNEGKSVNSIAKKLGITEGAIRYQISIGELKKK